VKVLLVPSVKAGMGSGHLRRSLHLAGIFGPDSAVLVEARDQELIADPRTLLNPLIGDSSTPRVLFDYDPKEYWDLVILDRRSSGMEQARRFSPTPVIGFDEGGASRPYLSYLIDSLPVYRQRHRANLTALSLLDLPEKKSEFHLPFRRVLISFGGEDPVDLSSSLLELLLGKKLFEPQQITVVQGPYFNRSRWPDGIEVLRSPWDLKSVLHRYDLVFCSFGLTTFEALAVGVPVINLNPAAHHRRLSAVAGIPEVGVRRPSIRKLRALLDHPQALEALPARYPQDILHRGPRASELPLRLQPSGPARCPVCSEAMNPAVARFAGRSYFGCRCCGVFYLIAFGREKTRYDREYFFSEYEKQYGKTYLEDFESIKGMAYRRLGNICSVLDSPGRTEVTDRPTPAVRRPATSAPTPAPPRLLDVGCAYGPFLQAARERGFQVQGLDVSVEAVQYVREELGIPCGLTDFSSTESAGAIEGADAGFDVISLWYVIEHFRDTERVLSRINRLLKPGGVFSFSTPNASGISARRDRTLFFKNSPPDHYTVWPLRAVAPVLARFGLELRKIVVTGHHGERFPWPCQLEADSHLAAGLSRLSRLLRLGDTFEAYAVKVRALP
jgi:2-polyprenyl-3-methyl-5-hydroxy-6-metoxy-1,4-benzoquinol methylase